MTGLASGLTNSLCHIARPFVWYRSASTGPGPADGLGENSAS